MRPIKISKFVFSTEMQFSKKKKKEKKSDLYWAFRKENRPGAKVWHMSLLCVCTIIKIKLIFLILKFANIFKSSLNL